MIGTSVMKELKFNKAEVGMFLDKGFYEPLQ